MLRHDHRHEQRPADVASVDPAGGEPLAQAGAFSTVS